MKWKRLTSLISTLINSHYGISYKKFIYFKKKERLWEPILITFAIFSMIVGMVPLYSIIMKTSFEQMTAMGLQNLFLMQAFTATTFIGFFFGLFIVVNYLFFSREMKVLLPLPLKPSEVMTAKFSVIILDQMLISLVLLLPPLIYFGVKTSQGLLYWFFAAVIFLLSQILPVMLATVIILPLYRVIKFDRYRDFFIFILASLLLVASLFFVAITNRMSFSGGFSPEALARILSDPESLINKVGRIYPPAILVVKSLTAGSFEGLIAFLGFVVLHVFVFLLLLYMGKKFYYSTYIELQEAHAKRTKVGKDELERLFGKSRSRFAALMAREWKYFLRVPSFSFNGFINVVIFPILLLIFASVNGEQMEEIKRFIPLIKPYAVPLGVLVAVLAGGINSLSPTLLSREGRLFIELKALPVSPTTIFVVKFTHIMTITIIAPIFVSIALHMFLELSLIQSLSIFFISTVNLLFLNLLQTMIDSKKPVLDWDNPSKAMKQNINVALTIPIIFGFVGGFGYLGFVLKGTLSPVVMSSILLLVGVAGSALCAPIATRMFGSALSRDV